MLPVQRGQHTCWMCDVGLSVAGERAAVACWLRAHGLTFGTPPGGGSSNLMIIVIVIVIFG